MPHDAYAALRIPNFLWLSFSYGISTIAREAQIVLVAWQVFQMTNDPLSLGMIGLAEALPFVAVALYAGHVADRVPRLPVAIAGTFGMFLSAVALLVFTTTGMIAQGRVWPVYLVIVLSGIARSFTRPAFSALAAEVVPRELYASSVAWRSSTWQFAAILGPAAGGLGYGFAGPGRSYAGVTALMAVALLALFLVTHRGAPADADTTSVRESVVTGLRFLFSQRVLLGAMTLDLFSVLFGGATALLPIFAKILGVGPQGLGVLRAAPAVGSLITGLFVAHRPPLRRNGVVLFGAVTMFGLSMIGFAISRSFWLSLALLVLSGMADNVSVIIRGTLLQMMTPRHLLGRVSSVNQIFIGSSNEIGAFESGVAARLLGTVPSVIFGGVMCIVVVAAVAAFSAPLRQLREIHAE